MAIVETTRPITGGVDTHLDVHVAAALDPNGGVLGIESFPTTAAGCAELADWLASFGPLTRVGVEGTGAYGAGLARHLRSRDVAVFEVDRPNRQLRRSQGKSDVVDAGRVVGGRTAPIAGCRRERLSERHADDVHGARRVLVQPPRLDLDALLDLQDRGANLVVGLVRHLLDRHTRRHPRPGAYVGEERPNDAPGFDAWRLGLDPAVEPAGIPKRHSSGFDDSVIARNSSLEIGVAVEFFTRSMFASSQARFSGSANVSRAASHDRS